MEQSRPLVIPAESSQPVALRLSDAVWSRLATTIQLTGVVLFAIGVIILVQRSNSVHQFIGVKDRTPTVSSMRYFGEIGFILLGLFLLLAVSHTSEGARTWISRVLFGAYRRWRGLTKPVRLGLTMLILLLLVTWNVVQIMSVPFSFTGDWDTRAAVYRTAKEMQLSEIIKGLNEGCLLCMPGGQPIENMTTGDDIGLFYFFGLAHKLGLVPASLPGYHRFIALSFAAIIIFSTAVVSLGFRSRVAGIVLALAITLFDTAKYYESMLITSYWVPGGAAILSGSMALALLGRDAHDRKIGRKPSFGFYYVVFAIWGLAAGWAYLGRSSAGPITLASALIVMAVLAARLRPLSRWLPALGLLLVGFGLVLGSFQFVLTWRFTRYNLSPPIPNTMSSHAFSHAVLVGMGYVTNDEGLLWNDGIGASRAARECPEATYLGPAYYNCVRDIVIRIILNNPNLLIRNLLAKLEATIQVTFTFFAFAPLALVALYTIRRPVYYLVFGLMLAMNVAPALLTVPYPSYLQGYFQIIVIFIAAGVILPGLRLADHLRQEIHQQQTPAQRA